MRTKWRGNAELWALAILPALALIGCGGGGSSTPPNPVPTLTSISPTSANAGGGPFTLTAMGTNFISGSVVRWNGSDRVTTFTSATQLTATVTSTDISAAGTVPVTVFNPSPGGGSSSAVTFTVNSPGPVITSLSPSSAPATGPGFTLTVAGSNFVSGSVVRWNGSDRATTFANTTSLTAAIPASDIASVGTVPVTVFNPAPDNVTSSPATFTVNPYTPPRVATSSLPDSAGGKNYNFTLAATDGAPPYMWDLAPGSLPLPLTLTLDPSSGRISGNVTPVGLDMKSIFTVRVTDSASTPQSATRSLSILVHSGALGRNDVCTPGSTAGTTAISNGRIRATISPYGDIDVYNFQLTATATNLTIETFAQKLDIGTNLTTRSDFLDTVLELLDFQCNVIALNDDLSASPHIQDSLIQVSSSPFPVGPFPIGSADKTPPTSLPAGTYFIRVRDFRGDGRPDLVYELSLSGAN